MRPARPPTPPQVAIAPELATLALVDHALAVTVRLLLAAHPELDETSPVFDWRAASNDLRLADDITRLAEALQGAIHDYHEHMSLFVGSTWSGTLGAGREPSA